MSADSEQLAARLPRRNQHPFGLNQGLASRSNGLTSFSLCGNGLKRSPQICSPPLVRSDQRAKGGTYLRGLLLDGWRKSMQPMADWLGVDHQGLQQFVTTSTWDTTAVRMRLAVWAVDVVGPVAWVVDVTGFPKDGKGSLGVAISPCAAAAASPADRRDQPAPRGTSRSCDPRPTAALP